MCAKMKQFYKMGLSFNLCSGVMDTIREHEQTIANICACSNKPEKEIIEFLQQNPISANDLEIFVKAFGKLPNESQISIIFKAKSISFYANFLTAHYLHNKEF